MISYVASKTVVNNANASDGEIQVAAYRRFATTPTKQMKSSEKDDDRWPATLPHRLRRSTRSEKTLLRQQRDL
jgi:hypothetical protein